VESPSSPHVILQKGDIDNDHRGKAAHYCQIMMDANPERLSATCILTNMEMMEVFQLERREGGGSFLSRSSPMTMLLEEGNKN